MTTAASAPGTRVEHTPLRRDISRALTGPAEPIDPARLAD